MGTNEGNGEVIWSAQISAVRGTKPGKINVLAVELHQWLASLGRGKALAYTLAVLTLTLSALLWFIGARAASLRETQAETPQTPSDAWS